MGNPPFLDIYKEIIKKSLGNGRRGLPQSSIFRSTTYKIPCQSAFRNQPLVFTPTQIDVESCPQLLPSPRTPPPGSACESGSWHRTAAGVPRNSGLGVPLARAWLWTRLGARCPGCKRKSPLPPQKETDSPLALQKTPAASEKKAF